MRVSRRVGAEVKRAGRRDRRNAASGMSVLVRLVSLSMFRSEEAPWHKSPIDVDDEVLRLVDDIARRIGLPREVVIARAVRQETAATVLAGLFQGNSSGVSDDEAKEIVEAERAGMRAERRAG